MTENIIIFNDSTPWHIFLLIYVKHTFLIRQKLRIIIDVLVLLISYSFYCNIFELFIQKPFNTFKHNRLNLLNLRVLKL